MSASGSHTVSAVAVLMDLPHPLLVFTETQQLGFANAALLRQAGLTAQALPPGMPQAEVHTLLARHNAFGVEDPTTLAAELTSLDPATPHHWLLRREDGRLLVLEITPLSGGGHMCCATLPASLAAVGEELRHARVLEEVLSHLSTGISRFGPPPERRLEMFNAAYPQVAGFSPGSIAVGMTFAETQQMLVARGAFDPAHTEALLEERVHADRTLHHATRWLRADGRSIDVNSWPMPDGGFLLEVTEITAMLEAQSEARSRSELLATVLAALPHGVCVVDRNCRIAMVNAAYNRIMAGSEARIGEDARALYHLRLAKGEYAGDPDAARQIGLAIDDRLSAPAVFERRRPNGTFIDISVMPIPEGGHVTVMTDVTPLRQAETAARDRAAQLQSILDHMPFGVALYDRAGHVRAFNTLATSLTGLTEEEMSSGMPLSRLRQLQHARGAYGRGPEADRILAARSAEELHEEEAFIRTRLDGTTIAVSTKRMEDGTFLRTYVDVTEDRRIRAELQRAEAEASKRAGLLQAMLDNTRHGICLFDAQGRVIAANALAARLTGLSTAQLAPGSSLQTLWQIQFANGEFGPGDSGAMSYAAHTALPMGERRRYIHIRPDGTRVEVVTERLADGGFARSYTDVTEDQRIRVELLRAEAEARSRATIMENMLANIRHGVILYSAEHRLLAVNSKAAEMAGIPPEAVRPGALMEDLLRAQQERGEFGEGKLAEKRVLNLFDEDRTQALRYLRVRPDGRILEVWSDPTPDGSFVVSFSDVTEDHRVRAELERAKNAAEAANRAKSRFLATMSHELRTPLNAVIGFAEALATPQPIEQQVEFAESIRDAGRQLLALIDNILDVARLEGEGMATRSGLCNLASLGERVLREIRPTAETAGVQVQAQIAANLPQIRVDTSRLQQVLMHLLSNAVKFTPRGGSAMLSMQQAGDGAVVIQVRDSGIGMAEDDIPIAFEAFSQLDASLARHYQGSGLGLYLARALAELLGGTLNLTSKPGHGTTATLRLPSSLIPAPTGLTAPPAPAVRGKITPLD